MVAAALEPDLTQLDQGRLTEIGERGVNISGGQKARISFARAIYSDADIYLLDDPLSAVDPAVASQIFENAIKGELASKCVILVTHQLQFMQLCPRVLLLKDGFQQILGSYDDLLTSGFDAEKIVKN